MDYTAKLLHIEAHLRHKAPKVRARVRMGWGFLAVRFTYGAFYDKEVTVAIEDQRTYTKTKQCTVLELLLMTCAV